MTTRCAVLGDPIDHSLSPVLHRAAYAALGLGGFLFDPVRVPAGSLAAFLAGLDDSWRGLALTMPLKREAVPLASSLTPTAVLAGAANTLVRQPDGAWAADNTDVPGLAAALRERAAAAWGPWGTAGAVESAVVLGGGATATSAGLALAALGCSSLHFLVRDPERARATADAVSAHPQCRQVHVSALDVPPETADVWRGRPAPDVVVSTIPVAAQTPAVVDLWSRAALVADAVYDPWPTPLAEAAAAAGAAVVTGLDLLAHQAALQFVQFTGQAVSVDVLREAGQAALAARGVSPAGR